MTAGALSYWRRGEEDRQIRVFVSHRHGDNKALYDQVIALLEQQGHRIQDLSVTEEMLIGGPKGGQLPDIHVQAEIAARIYTADLMIAPARPATTRADWLVWEITLAAVGYGVPVVFVSEPNSKYKTSIVSEIAKWGLPHAVCAQDSSKIVRNAIDLMQTRPTWNYRDSEEAPTTRFRGPPEAARQKVMRQFPYRPRLSNDEENRPN
jgi:hypothetical protein